MLPISINEMYSEELQKQKNLTENCWLYLIVHIIYIVLFLLSTL